MSRLTEQLSQLLNIPINELNDLEVKSLQNNESFIVLLESSELAQEEEILKALSQVFRTQFVRLENMEISETIINLVPKDLAIKNHIIPIDRVGSNIVIAMSDTRNLNAIDSIRFATGYSTRAVLASDKRIQQALDKYYGKKMAFNVSSTENTNINNQVKVQDSRTIIGSTERGADTEAPAIKIVNELLVQCLQMKASDIHYEVYESTIRVRFRIDGVLHEIGRPPFYLKDALISRIKIMANLNIAEKRLPQDGGIRVQIGEKPVDFRVSVLPTIYGEKIVMRILDKSSLQVDMEKLGFESDDLERFKESIHRPDGMVLVTGPTGSGKTTTLYSALADLNKVTDNIMTAEDPVEFNLEGINQVQMKAEINLNFAAALRSFLRQDPDIVMVGEIRDLETAEIAIKAALTGHLVLSTLHTNSAPDTVIRMINMGVEPFNLVSALNAVVAQRLIRRICEKCKTEDKSLTPDMFSKLGISEEQAKTAKIFHGAGCPACNFLGCKGRVAIHEVMIVNEEMKNAIIRNIPATELKRIAMKNGMHTLRQSAVAKLLKGMVPASEVFQNTNFDENPEPSTNEVTIQLAS